MKSTRKHLIFAFTILAMAAGVFTLPAWADDPLTTAVKANDKAKVQALIAGGANVKEGDKDGYTPLHWAAINGKRKAPNCCCPRA